LCLQEQHISWREEREEGERGERKERREREGREGRERGERERERREREREAVTRGRRLQFPFCRVPELNIKGEIRPMAEDGERKRREKKGKRRKRKGKKGEYHKPVYNRGEKKPYK
jgi:hypothetical protein